jgi:hypothetical protein
MSKKNDLPAMPWYVGDWMKCPEVRACTLAERGLWFDMLNLMWESHERGYLINPSGRAFTGHEIARMVGENPDLVIQMLKQLADNHVYSIRDKDGAIYCRRMVKDESIRQIRRAVGSKGGNPILVKQRDNLLHEDESEDEDANESLNSFSLFSFSYPQKSRINESENIYNEICKKISPAVLIQGAKDYDFYCRLKYADDYPQSSYIMLASNWIQKECWKTNWKAECGVINNKKKNDDSPESRLVELKRIAKERGYSDS